MVVGSGASKYQFFDQIGNEVRVIIPRYPRFYIQQVIPIAKKGVPHLAIAKYSSGQDTNGKK